MGITIPHPDGGVKNLFFSNSLRVSPRDYPLTEKPEHSGYKIELIAERSLKIQETRSESQLSQDPYKSSQDPHNSGPQFITCLGYHHSTKVLSRTPIAGVKFLLNLCEPSEI